MFVLQCNLAVLIQVHKFKPRNSKQATEKNTFFLVELANELMIHTGDTLLSISEFVLDEMFLRNASKFAVFYIYDNPNGKSNFGLSYI